MRHRNESGFTLIELLIVTAIIAILAAMATQHLFAAKRSANEASAIGTLRALNSGEAAYSASCGRGHYSESVADLVASRFLSPDADLSPKSGFVFLLTGGAAAPGPADCAGNPTSSAYYFSATRLGVSTGSRGFATDESAVVWQDTAGSPPVEPFTVSATVSPIQ